MNQQTIGRTATYSEPRKRQLTVQMDAALIRRIDDLSTSIGMLKRELVAKDLQEFCDRHSNSQEQ